VTPSDLRWSLNNTLQAHAKEEGTHKEPSDRGTHASSQQKMVMAVPGFEPGSSGSQPLMLTTTLYHHCWNTSGILGTKKVGLMGGAQAE
jgi:hypothetical protein